MTTEPNLSCSLRDEQLPDRLALIDELARQASRVERTRRGAVLWFATSQDRLRQLEHFVDAEQDCCGFWDFEVITAPALGLRWEGPPETAEFLTQVVETNLRARS